MKLKLIAIASILVASMIGVCLPLFSGAVPALRPDKDLFVVVKAFASGVILATGYMHVLPDSFADLESECLPENPWRKFPFTTFVAMISALVTLMVESIAMSHFKRKRSNVVAENGNNQVEHGNKDLGIVEHGHGLGLGLIKAKTGPSDSDSKLLRNRVVAQVKIHFLSLVFPFFHSFNISDYRGSVVVHNI